MTAFTVSIFLLLSYTGCSSGFRRPYEHELKYASNDQPVGEPVFLTPLIKEGRLEYARDQCRVPPLKGNVKSYAGFLTVNETYQSNMFFWFFPAEKNYDQSPVVLWLQGGPGSSSLYGLFVENGPYAIHRKQLRLRTNSWSKEHSVLYIDNPVGTGYSFTRDEKGYVKDQTEVGRDLFIALTQFFTLFSNFAKNDFFIIGESYGGKYVPAIAYTIHNTSSPSVPINLKGIAMGNGFSDPENMLAYGDYLYQLGLIDSNFRKQFHDKEDQIREMISRQEWKNASIGFTELIDSDDQDQNSKSLFQEATGLSSYFNYVEGVNSDDGLSDVVQEARIRKAIHVGNLTWNDGLTVQKYLQEDIPKSVRPWIQELLTAYRVLVYNGQLDVIVAYPLTESYLQKLDWKDKPIYDTAVRSIWRVGGKVAGYVKVAGNLTDVMVRDAGHMVPLDQPVFAYNMIRNFTRNMPLA